MPQTEPTDAEKGTLARAITRAQGLAEKGHDAPIVAAVMEEDDVLAWGDNEVHLDHDPSRHAEIVAIAAACEARESADLKGLTLVTTLQPCEMCLGAMRFAGISRIVFAAGRPHVDDRYFVYHGLSLEEFDAASDGGIDWAGHVMEEDVLNLYGKGAAEPAA
ncbi:nucleoside deaminase [Palleronia sp. LCG004]|uniref:nucleoside deaminase n=1 Tax=Palleronia sp. LCG004 TaxID=3079304 RepID=UPI002943B29A|nr:nucleoside deaminase [Palleronia sp. LCG004]WOI56645.1 nucleoside deaminase [Palleronia sp. LCG004]